MRKKCKLIKSILAKTVQERIEKIEGDFKDGKSTEEQLIKDLKELLSEIGHRTTNGCDVKPRFPVHNDDIENGTAVAVNEEPMETGFEESEVEQGNVGINSGNVRSGSSRHETMDSDSSIVESSAGEPSSAAHPIQDDVQASSSKSTTEESTLLTKEESPTATCKNKPRSTKECKRQPGIKEMFAKGSLKRKQTDDGNTCSSSSEGESSSYNCDNAETGKDVKRQRLLDDNDDEKKTVGDTGNERYSLRESSETTKPGEKKIQPPAKCKECKQLLTSPDLRLFPGDSDDAVEEFVALTDPRLSLFSGDEEQFDSYNDRPQHKITNFSIYDKNTHLCPFDSGLIEKNIELFFSGYLKPIYDENPSPEGGVPTKSIGPINEWWVAGFDGGENSLIGFTTAFAEYILMQASEEYMPFMNLMREKIAMSKIVIEFIQNNPEARYEDLLNKVETSVPPVNCLTFTEDTLLRHAQFLVEQVESYDQAADDDELPLLVSACMRDLIKLAGVTLGKRRAARGVKVKLDKKKTGPSKATTTPLVRHIFDIFFKDQIDGKEATAPRRKRCGVCEVCQQADCGDCKSCKDMVKFGGTGRKKQCCEKRKCPYMAVQEADEDEDVVEEMENVSPNKEKTKKNTQTHKTAKSQKGTNKKVAWIGDPIKVSGKTKYYSSVLINKEEVHVGDFVKVNPKETNIPLYIACVCYMWEASNGDKMFHCRWLWRGSETLLGETSDVSELFLIDDCEDKHLFTIAEKCTVTHKKPDPDWFMKGGLDDLDAEAMMEEDDGNHFFYQKWYDPELGRFIDPPSEYITIVDRKEEFKYCESCTRKAAQNQVCVYYVTDSMHTLFAKK